MAGNWQNSFGSGSPIRPSSPSYERVDLTEDTTLVWPLESSPGTPSLAGLLNIVPGTADLVLSLPDATQGGTGIVAIITNSGSTSFTLGNYFAQQVGVIAAGEAWVLSLYDNGSQAGAWNLIQLGTLTSEAQAGQLAGAGLAANGAVLDVSIQTFTYTADQLISTAQDASGIILAGAVARTFQLDAISTLGDGWWCLVSNQATDDLTISVSGSDTINGVAQLVLPPGGSGQPYSCLIVASSTGFNTFAGTPPIIPVAGGGTGANTAGQALINLGGGTVGIQIFEAETAAAVLAILGLGASSFKELTVSTDQNLNEDSINNAYVCTAALTISLQDSTVLSNEFVIAIYAQGAAVTVAPVLTDAINGGTAGANLGMAQGTSMLLTTDANGNWWPFFYGATSSSSPAIPWCIATGTGDVISAAYSPPITALTDGLLLSFRSVAANASGVVTFNPDGLGASPVKKYGNNSLTPADISGPGGEALVRWNNAGAYWDLVNPLINLELVGNTRGQILARFVNYWAPINAGDEFKVLTSNGLLIEPIYDWPRPGPQQTVASAGVMDLGGDAAYHNALITGVAVITDFGSNAGATTNQPIYWLEFDDACTLTNSVNLICPGGANIVTAAGDTAIVQYMGTNVWKIRQYSRFAVAP